MSLVEIDWDPWWLDPVVNDIVSINLILSITWNLSVQGRLRRNFDRNYGGFFKKTFPEISN
jgi:hypothetical protein